MPSFKARALVLAICALPLLATGCGKVPGSVSGGKEGVVAYNPHFASKANTQPVGTLVDGRLYAKGQEPSVTVTPPPAVPTDGNGNLHVAVSLAGVTDFVGKIRIRLRHDGDADSVKDVATFDFLRSKLIGSSVQTTLTDVAPGDYIVVKDTLSTTGGIFLEESANCQVIGGKTSESKI